MQSFGVCTLAFSSFVTFWVGLHHTQVHTGHDTYLGKLCDSKDCKYNEEMLLRQLILLMLSRVVCR